MRWQFILLIIGAITLIVGGIYMNEEGLSFQDLLPNFLKGVSAQSTNEKIITEDTPTYFKDDFNTKYGIISIAGKSGNKLAEYSLTENTEKCRTECSARGKAILYNDGLLFDDITFLDLKTDYAKELPYHLYIGKGYENKTRQNCIEQKINYSERYSDKYIVNEKDPVSERICTNETYIEPIWKDYKYETLKAGNYEWKLEGTKLSQEDIDWIAISNTKSLTEWADWYSIAPFISTWNTSKVSGDKNVTLPIYNGGIYNFTVDWGDGAVQNITAWDNANKTHNYSIEGVYTIIISGTINGWRFNNAGDKLKIINISQWGDLQVGNSNAYFFGCSNLNSNATDALNLTGTTTMSNMFNSASAFNGNISNWDTSNVTSMSYMFNSATAFNQNIGNWDTSKVINMSSMFQSATAFNQNIGNWNVSSLTTATSMFTNIKLSTANYDSLLIGWASLSPNLKGNATFSVLFHGGNSKYACSVTARNTTLIGVHNWTITDGGYNSTYVCDCWTNDSVNKLLIIPHDCVFQGSLGV